MELLKERSLQLLSVVALVIVWQIAATIIDSSALPPPGTVAVEFWQLVEGGDALAPLYSSLLSTVLGFVLGFLLGFVYGILANLSPRFEMMSSGLFNIALFTPTLIVIFLGLIMLGHDNRLTVVLVVGFSIFTTVGTYIRDALRELDAEIVAMATSFKVGLLQRLKDIYIPHLIPPMLGAGRIAFSMAWKVAFLAEVFGFPEGLGWNVRSAYTVYDMPRLLAWLSVFVVAILIVEQLTRMLERAVVKW